MFFIIHTLLPDRRLAIGVHVRLCVHGLFRGLSHYLNVR